MKSGKRAASYPPEVELALLKQIETYGMTSRLVWEHTASLKSFSATDITACLRALSKSGIVEAYPLHHGRFYFTFARHHTLNNRTSRWRGGAFGEAEKCKAFAKLVVGTLHLPGAVPCTAEQHSRLLGEGGQGLSLQFMLQPEQKKVFYPQVDTSLVAYPSRTAQRLRDAIFRLAKLPAIKHLVQQQQFELLLLAVTAQRAESILNHFRRYDRVGGTPIRPLVVPELMPLLTAVPIGGKSPKFFA
jgi:hypothetical protein